MPRMFRIVACAAFLLSFEAWGAEYYVRSSVNCPNNGDGTLPTCAGSTNGPGAIRNHNNTQGATFAPGDTVYICDVLPSSSSPQWNSTIESGTLGNPVVFDGNCPMGDGTYRQGGYDALGTTNYAFSIATTSPDHITWRNLILENAANDCVNINVAAATGLRFENITIEDCGVDGLDVDNTASGGLALDNVSVYRAAAYGISCNNSLGGTWQNLFVYDSGTAGAGNNDGLAINDYCGDGKTINNVKVYRQKSEDGSGIDLQDSYGTGTLTLTRAYVEGGEGTGYSAVCITGVQRGTQTIKASGVILKDNRIGVYLKDCDGLHELSNFTTIGHGTTELKLGDSGTSGDALTAVVKNSSFGGASCVGQAAQYRDNASVTITTNHNQYCPGGEFSMTAAGTKTFAEWQVATSQDANSLEADPQFIGGTDPTTAEGFRLSASSPLAAAGTDLGDEIADYFGDYMYNGRWDIGAFRRDSCYRRSVDGNLNKARSRSEVATRCLGIPGRYPEGL